MAYARVITYAVLLFWVSATPTIAQQQATPATSKPEDEKEKEKEKEDDES